MCYFQMNSDRAAEDTASQALRMPRGSSNPKAYYRRALARRALGDFEYVNLICQYYHSLYRLNKFII